MAMRRVFVIWTNPLLHESARLYLKHPGIIIVGAASYFTIAHEDIMRLQPDTILFEKTCAGVPVDVM